MSSGCQSGSRGLERAKEKQIHLTMHNQMKVPLLLITGKEGEKKKLQPV